MKKILMVCFAVLMLCQATAFAARLIPKEEMYVGGIGLDCTLGYVKEIYGEPKEVIRTESGKAGSKMGITYYITYKYSDTFNVTGKRNERDSREENELRVNSVFIRDNSLATPSGLTVGMPYAAVVEMFGEGEKLTYQGKTWYSYSPNQGGIKLLQFMVNDEGTITEIGVYSQH